MLEVMFIAVRGSSAVEISRKEETRFFLWVPGRPMLLAWVGCGQVSLCGARDHDGWRMGTRV